ncbi:G-protein coupled receptor 84 [Polymixia lowei]
MLLNNTDHSGNDSFSCYHPSVVGYRYFAILWGCAVTITGTVGNLMTVLAFAVDSRLRTRFNKLIINLALADLLYCTILQPISIDSYLHLRWRGGQLWCRAFGLLLFLSNSVSIITLCLIAGSRYLLVEKRAVFDRVFSDRGLALLLPSTWALGLASFAPLWAIYVFVPQVCTCSFHRTTGRPYTTILLFFYFFIGLGCVGLFYLLIYRRVRIAARALIRYRFSRRSSRKKPASSAQGTEEDSGVDSGVANTCSCDMSSQGELAQNKGGITCVKSPGETQHSHSTLGSAQISHLAGNEEPPPALDPVPLGATPAPTTAPSSSPSSAPGDDGEFKRVTRMCFTVFLCFVFCFVPFLLLNIADKHNRAPQVLHMFCANLTWLNSCVNPLLYAVMNRQFRQAYYALLTRAATPFTYFWTRLQALGS